MKQIFLSTVIAFLFAGIITSCQKEGPAGPAGPVGAAGQKGEKGDKGIDGNMKIIVKNVTVSSWEPTGTSMIHSQVVGIPEITAGIINSGAVLAYLVDGTTLIALPYSWMDVGESVMYYVYNGKIKFEFNYTKPQSAQDPTTFRIIIIPGSQNGRVKSGDGLGNTIGQLRKMSYQQVCDALHIRP